MIIPNVEQFLRQEEKKQRSISFGLNCFWFYIKAIFQVRRVLLMDAKIGKYCSGICFPFDKKYQPVVMRACSKIVKELRKKGYEVSTKPSFDIFDGETYYIKIKVPRSVTNEQE